MIIGEALSKLAKLDVAVASRISEHRGIIAFRNLLVHAYSEVDDLIVWGIIETDLPLLRQQAAELLREAEERQK